jgi:hypothetical protein
MVEHRAPGVRRGVPSRPARLARPWAALAILAVVGVTVGVVGAVVGAAPAGAYRPSAVIRPITFPVQGPVTYRDDFGACRDGCSRRHQGNDLIGARHLPLVAAAAGVIDWFRVDTGSGTAGNALSIRDAEGWRYVYVHLNNDTPGTDDGLNPLEHAFAPGIERGATVVAGQPIGWLGDSGNAEWTAPHLHFEIITPRGVAISPWASLRVAEGARVSAPAGDYDRCAASTNPAYTDGDPAGAGLWVLGRDGGVFAFGASGFHGSTGGMRLNRPVVAMAPTRSGRGYWLVASDGGIFAFGDAVFHGSAGGLRLNRPVVGMAATPSGAGYWLVASDGGIFAFGDAAFRGSTGAIVLNQPIVSMAATPSGAGYWLLARDGGLFAFGDATFHGSLPGVPAAVGRTAVAMAPTATGAGYWILTSDGEVWPFGDAVDLGSLAREGLCTSVAPRAAALVRSPGGRGYTVVGSDGSAWVYGDARWVGDLPDARVRPNAPVLGGA